MPFSNADHLHMTNAILEGSKGLGFVAPNPAVGCIIVDKFGVEVGRGFHSKAGAPHAEVEALNSVAIPESLKNATLYVTLEPCASQGKTPSCAHRLAKLPLARVIFGCKDPNPKMAGGQKILQQQGIKCDHFEAMSEECLELVEVFFCNQLNQRPFVHLKVGASIDGQMGLKNGASQWITGEESRAQVQKLRGQMDAVLIGRKTFEIDNPRLNSRDSAYENKTNAVIVVDPEAKILNQLKGSKLLTVRPEQRVFIIVSKGAQISSDLGVNIIECSMDGSKLNLKQALVSLYAKGVHSILLEGGAETIGNFFKSHLVDRLTLFMAPQILGAGGGINWTKGLSIESLEEVIQLKNMSVSQHGADFCFSSRITYNARPNSR